MKCRMRKEMGEDNKDDEDWLEGVNQTNIRYDSVWSMGSNKFFKDSDYYQSYLDVLKQHGKDRPAAYQPGSIPNLGTAKSAMPESDTSSWMTTSTSYSVAKSVANTTPGNLSVSSPPQSPKPKLQRPTSPRASSMDSPTPLPPKTTGETYLDMLETAKDLHFKPPVYMRIPKFNY